MSLPWAARGLKIPYVVRNDRQRRRSSIVHCHHITGNFDYLLQVEVADLPAYEDFHANHLAGLPGVATVTSYVTMKTLSADTPGAAPVEVSLRRRRSCCRTRGAGRWPCRVRPR
ncbi:Lrp/AsnC ligand binding domain-containing protein [Streptomyces phaeofaciens]|uniref:Lrp/AsnC ligand binding domain-containing protein n=1 Tax=Streptomyces phaeofaciens TaxID=68254 RepID=UPI00369FA463